MEPKAKKVRRVMALPVEVTGPIEVGRLLREVESVDEKLRQLSLRNGGPPPQLPGVSYLLNHALELNKLNLLQATDRTTLKRWLEIVRAKAPVLHMSFSADPPTDFLVKVVTWLRQEIHPVVLVTVGLQPNLGAGCILRTTNKQFDFSLRQDIKGKRDLLLQLLAKSQGKPA